MSKRTNLHPSVQQFKQFVKKHPALIKEVREGNKTWQDFYEEWTIFGEKDKIWEKYKSIDEDIETTKNVSDKKSSSSVEEDAQKVDLLSLLKSVNLNDIQGHIKNLSGMVASVQGLLSSFQSNSSTQSSEQTGNSQNQQSHQNQQNHTGPQQHPFNFRHF